MTGKTHCLGGILASSGAILAVTSLNPGISLGSFGIISFIVGGAVGSLFPDIDEPNSRISHRLPLLSGLFSLYRFRKKSKASMFFLNREDRQKAKQELRDASHRGITHYLLTWAIIFGLTLILFALSTLMRHRVLMLAAFFLAGFFIGGVSHIFLDLISGRIPVFAPFYRKSVGICIFKTDGLLEVTLVRLLLVIGIFVTWKRIIAGIL